MCVPVLGVVHCSSLFLADEQQLVHDSYDGHNGYLVPLLDTDKKDKTYDSYDGHNGYLVPLLDTDKKDKTYIQGLCASIEGTTKGTRVHWMEQHYCEQGKEHECVGWSKMLFPSPVQRNSTHSICSSCQSQSTLDKHTFTPLVADMLT